MQLNNNYNRDELLKFLEEDFLTDFKKDLRPVSTQGVSPIQKAYSLGKSESLDLQVFEFFFEGSPNKRVTLTKDAFQVMKSSAIFRALAIFHSPNNDDWRLSLMTATPERTETGKVELSYSNPKRLSFFLGPNAKVNTPTKFILKKGPVVNFEDLKNRFSIEVVNKEFYKEISEYFTQLVGGSLYKGKKKEDYKALLKLPFIQDKSQTSLEFAVRLIGRIIFCWFLREKKSDQGKSLMPNNLLSLEAVKKYPNYYHKILEPIFFEVLNKPGKLRKDDYSGESFSSIPYLNGGLFFPHNDDYYKRTNGDSQSQFHNTLVVPDEWLTKFFQVLETYNFTIDENTSFDEELSIDPEMLGRIFENLLAEINPETGESARKSTGSYYTPRVIVNYMVDESLLLYLKNQTQIDEKKLRAVISYDLSDDEEIPLKDDDREKIINALEKVKILDPACGSGAFPIGALQKIVFILQQTDPEGQLWFKKQIKNTPPEIRKVIEREFAHKNFDYIRKLGIIRENIYGVDIQPIATEISRLRCFLTLVVDERIQEDLENRGIEPLPNLDFKFVTANTLIGLPDSQVINQMGLFEDNAGIEELKELRNIFFNASGTERDQLKLQFVQAQNSILQRLISEERRGLADLTTKLTTWDPFSHKLSTWFDSGWMFGIKGGFDIVIGNPPYIQLQKDGGTLANLYKNCDYKTFERSGDIYCLFYEKGINLLQKEKYLCLITSNKWMRAGYGEKLRLFFTEHNPIKLIDLGPGMFESATVDTNILIIQKMKNQKNTQAATYSQTKLSLNDYMNKNAVILNNLTKDAWSIGTNAEQKLKEKIERIGRPLKEWDIKIYRGILTGLNKAFIIDKNTKEQLCSEDPKSLEILKPILRGRDIKRYGYEWAGLWLIMCGFNIDVPQKYPAVYKHLLQFKKEAKIRDDQGKNWWNLRSCNYYSEFEKMKIVWGNIAYNSSFTILDKGIYLNAPGNMITGNKISIRYLLGCLNSKIFNYEFKKIGIFLGHAFEWKKQYVEQVHIPFINPENHPVAGQIENWVDKILAIIKSKDYCENPGKQATVKEYENQIDQMVYKLYELTPKEIEIVEISSNKK